tara:strand:- start:43 stop:360 length:318 start_codon:yes stop_codon:yes gene_type:complete
MNFDTTHEYSLSDPSIYYCQEHEGVVLYEYAHGQENQVRITGVKPESILNLSRNFFCAKDPDFLKVEKSEGKYGTDAKIKEIYDALGKYLSDKSEKDLNESLNEE